MPLLASILMVACLSAANAQTTQNDRLVRLSIMKNNGIAGTEYTAMRYANMEGIDVHPDHLNFNRVAASGVSSLFLQNYKDAAYYANISFGTPPQATIVQIDTGSAAFWIGSKACNVAKNCNDLYPFDSTASSTFKNISNGKPSNVTYGAGSIGGILSTDVMTWGTFQIPNQQFILTDFEDPTIFYQQNGSVTGLVGFAYQGGLNPSISAMGYYQTPIYTMVTSGMISNPIFSMWLNGSTTGGIQGTSGGEVIIGGVDSAHYVGDIMYYPIANVSKNYFWMIEMTGVQVSSTLDVNNPTASLKVLPLNLTASYGLMDSGTSLITIDPNFYTLQLLPALQANSLRKPVPLTTDLNTGFTRVSCTDAQRLPSIGITFGGKGVAPNQPFFEITWQDYVLSDEKGCYLGFQAMNMKNTGEGKPVWIFGDVYLRKIFTVYDMGNGGRVGLAYAANTAKPFGVPVSDQAVAQQLVETGNATVASPTKRGGAGSVSARLLWFLLPLLAWF